MRLTDAIGQLTATVLDWDGLLVNPEYIRRGQTIIWQTYERPMLPEAVRFSDVATMAEARQYSFQLLTDGSLFQLYYRYENDNTTLANATLSYYEGKSPSEDEGEDENQAENGAEEQVFARWLRIDFNSTDPRCSLHNDCHLHISGLPGARAVLDGVPTPKQFVDLVMMWCYPDLYAERCLEGGVKGTYREAGRQDRVHENSFPFVNDVLFGQLIHLRVPRR